MGKFIIQFLIIFTALVIIVKVIPYIVKQIIEHLHFRYKLKIAELIYGVASDAVKCADYAIRLRFMNDKLVHFDDNYTADMIDDAISSCIEYRFISLITQTYIMQGFTRAMRISWNADSESFNEASFAEYFTNSGYENPVLYVNSLIDFVFEEYYKYKDGASNRLIFTPKSKLSEILTIVNSVEFKCTYFEIKMYNVNIIQDLYSDIVRLEEQMEEQNGTITQTSKCT